MLSSCGRKCGWFWTSWKPMGLFLTQISLFEKKNMPNLVFRILFKNLLKEPPWGSNYLYGFLIVVALGGTIRCFGMARSIGSKTTFLGLRKRTRTQNVSFCLKKRGWSPELTGGPSIGVVQSLTYGGKRIGMVGREPKDKLWSASDRAPVDPPTTWRTHLQLHIFMDFWGEKESRGVRRMLKLWVGLKGLTPGGEWFLHKTRFYPQYYGWICTTPLYRENRDAKFHKQLPETLITSSILLSIHGGGRVLGNACHDAGNAGWYSMGVPQIFVENAKFTNCLLKPPLLWEVQNHVGHYRPTLWSYGVWTNGWSLHTFETQIGSRTTCQRNTLRSRIAPRYLALNPPNPFICVITPVQLIHIVAPLILSQIVDETKQCCLLMQKCFAFLFIIIIRMVLVDKPIASQVIPHHNIVFMGGLTSLGV